MDLLTANNYDAYRAASWGAPLRERGLFIMTDLDKTMTLGNNNPYPEGKELADRKKVRTLMAESGAVTAAVSARTLGLMMSSLALATARTKGYTEPEPRWGMDAQGKCVFVPIEQDPFFDDCLDFDLLGSFGEGIVVSQPDGYALDVYYDELLKYGESEAQRRRRELVSLRSVRNQGSAGQYKEILALQQTQTVLWRIAVLQFLLEIEPEISDFMHKMEFLKNYAARETNVAPLKARIQLHFEGPQGLAKMQEIIARVNRLGEEKHPLAGRINAVDESKIFYNEPEKNKYVMYLVPDPARKENLIRRMYHGVSAAAEAANPAIPRKALKRLYADDALTGFKAGLWGSIDYFLLPAQSPLAPFIVERRPSYGLESLEFLWKNHTRCEDRLRPVKGERGVYKFCVPTRLKKPNILVIADERYEGETPPGSVARFIEEFGLNDCAGL